METTNANNVGRHQLISTLDFLSNALLQQGFVLRGGITFGDIYHQGAMVFGPALIKAYELESKSAIYPRIILDPQLADAWGQGEVFIDRDGSLLGQSKTWRSSHDGFRFFDFLQPFGGTHDFQNSSGLIKMKLEPLREILKRCLEQHRSNSGVWQKYVWLANYFNTVCIEHTGHDVAPLEINW